jgi:hypothetical protein
MAIENLSSLLQQLKLVKMSSISVLFYTLGIDLIPVCIQHSPGN